MVEEVSISTDRIADLRFQHHDLTEQLGECVRQINELRDGLRDVVNAASMELTRLIMQRPGKPSSCYWDIVGEYWRSFELFAEKLECTCQQLGVPFTPGNHLFDLPDEDTTEQQWEDMLDTLDDALDMLKMGRQERAYFLSMIELIDSIERLAELQWPKIKGKGSEYYNALQGLKRAVRHFCIRLEVTLQKHDVTPVDLAVQEYPPPELTRVIARTDEKTDDNIIISEIAAKGYTWQGRLLRKADVIVVTNKGT